jgi:hypothetical protein
MFYSRLNQNQYCQRKTRSVSAMKTKKTAIVAIAQMTRNQICADFAGKLMPDQAR